MQDDNSGVHLLKEDLAKQMYLYRRFDLIGGTLVRINHVLPVTALTWSPVGLQPSLTP